MTTPERPMIDPRLVEVLRTTQRIQREADRLLGPKKPPPPPVIIIKD